MRFHSDHHHERTVLDALRVTGLHAEGVYFDTLSVHGSRSRARAFEIKLRADTGADRFGQTRRARNTGRYGADSYDVAATYDEWGILIAELLRVDEDAVFGPYKGRDDFDTQTNYEFATDAYGLAARAARDVRIAQRAGDSVQDISCALGERTHYVRRILKSNANHV